MGEIDARSGLLLPAPSAARVVLYKISHKIYTPTRIHRFIYAKFHTISSPLSICFVNLYENSHKIHRHTLFPASMSTKFRTKLHQERFPFKRSWSRRFASDDSRSNDSGSNDSHQTIPIQTIPVQTIRIRRFPFKRFRFRRFASDDSRSDDSGSNDSQSGRFAVYDFSRPDIFPFRDRRFRNL